MASMDFITLEYKEYSNYGILTLDHPEHLNAMSPCMISEIHDFFSLPPSENIRFILIVGRGKCFSTGGDLESMNSMRENEASIVSQNSHDAFRLIRQYPIPVVAVVHGFAVGGGFEIALACDMIYCTPDVYFLLPELNFNMIPGGGGCVRLVQKIGYQQAFSHIFSRQKIEADRAYSMGIVQRIIQSSDYISEAVELLTKFTDSTEKEAISILKSTLNLVEDYNDLAYRIESKNFSYLLSKYAKQKIEHFLNKK